MDAHIGSYIFYEDLYRSNRITTYIVPFVIGMLPARDSIVDIIIPSSISLLASLFNASSPSSSPSPTPSDLNESTNVSVKTGGSRVGGPELCV